MKTNQIFFIQNMNFAFSKSKPFFFENISISFELGKIHFIRGENGIGKSVFLNIMRGFIEPEQICTGIFNLNNIIIDLSKTKKLTHEYKKQFTLVHQNCNNMLVEQLTVEQNLKCANMPKYPKFSHLPKYNNIGDHNIKDLIAYFSINTKKTINLLSGGQKQIIAILMALQKNAKIILLDEPTAALDENNANMVMQFIETLTQSIKITALIICHDKDLVNKYAHENYYQLSLNQQNIRAFEKVKVVPILKNKM